MLSRIKHDNLFHAMDLLSRHSALLINENNSFSKLITTRVVADALRDYPYKFLLHCSTMNKTTMKNNKLIRIFKKKLY